MAGVKLNFLLLALCAVSALAYNSFVNVCQRSADYCDEALCKGEADDGGEIPKHVACPASAGFSADTCPANVVQEPMTPALKKLFLDLHNAGRDKIANGDLPGYDSASRMIQMVWDPELECVAGFNARTCTFGHDKCRNTKAYGFSGQNIAIRISTPNCTGTEEAIKILFDDWYNEYTLTDMDNINSFKADDGGPEYGHFTQIVSDRASSVGCALTRFYDHNLKNKKKNRWSVYIVCNYALSNMDGEPVYVSGPPASGCQDSVSSQYTHLCSPAESKLYKPVPKDMQ